jgi:glycosyltransferase involved in cell wall biosynthesis
MSRTLRILTIGHSHVVAVNRAMWRTLAEDPSFSITVAAPKMFQGDLRPLTVDLEPEGSRLNLVSLDAAWTGRMHVFHYDHPQLRQLMHEGEFDIVHAWEEPYIYAGYQIARSLRDSPSRFVFRTAQSLLKRYPPPFNLFERQTLRRAQAWIAGGHLVFEAMLKRGFPQETGRVLTLAVDVAAFRPLTVDQRGEVLEELRMQSPVLGFLGRLSQDKGLDILMRAVELLPASQPWNLLLLGSF